MIAKESPATIELIKKAFEQNSNLVANVALADHAFDFENKEVISITAHVYFTVNREDYDKFLKDIE